MHVSVTDFKSALALFETELIGTMKTKFNQFLLGAAFAAFGGKTDELLAKVTGEDGMIDTDMLKAVIDAGMRQCGGEFELPISFGILNALGARPTDIRITKIDTEKFFTQTLPAVARPTITEEVRQ